MNMQWLMQYAFEMLGRPYHWGGDDPMSGFDCSGFVQELLMASAVIPRGTGKVRAADLFDYLMKNGGSQGVFGPGSIAFFGGSPKEISHVGFCLDSQYMLHYGGGDSSTTSEAAASARNAFGRMDLIKYRKDFLCVVKPIYRPPA